MTRTIASLSSIPPRFGHLGPTLRALLAQSLPFDEIRLVIPHRYRRFPDWDGVLPEVPAGVTVHRCDEDLGPATKVLPTAKALRGEDVWILFCDDDRIYPPGLHARFRRASEAHPGCCIIECGEDLPDIPLERRPASRLPRVRPRKKGLRYRLIRLFGLALWKPSAFDAPGYTDILMGCGGVMVRPDWFDETAFEIPEALRNVDDPWLSGHLERRGVPIWLNRPPGRGVLDWSSDRLAERLGAREALLDLVVDAQDRRASDAAAVAHMRLYYGIWQ